MAVFLLYLPKPWLHADIEGADKLCECSAEKWHQNSCSVVPNYNGWAGWLINPPYQQHIACLHQNSPDLSKPASSPGPLFSTYLGKSSFQHSPEGTSTWLGCPQQRWARVWGALQRFRRLPGCAQVCAALTLGWALVGAAAQALRDHGIVTVGKVL